VALAIDEDGLEGYEFVEITGDAKCPAVLGGEVTLDEGEDLTCTIVNTDISPHLVLIKEVDNQLGGTASPGDWNLAADGPTPVNGDGGLDEDVDAGTYTLSESHPTDGAVSGGVYMASEWTCTGDGTQDGPSITLEVGDTAECTIINSFVPAVPVPVNNPLALLLMMLTMLATGWYFRPEQYRNY
jgi:hypothetical protein